MVGKYALILLVLLFVGCSQQQATISEQESQRLIEIQERSQGKWERLSGEEKKYMVERLGHGNEVSARMLLSPKKD